LVYYISLKL